ncbi:adhesion G protein-coupled receptor B2 [Trichonephila clavipes]|nr:adhesion G protein-coupled receptor B2 [Trichonephila clavipes]
MRFRGTSCIQDLCLVSPPVQQHLGPLAQKRSIAKFPRASISHQSPTSRPPKTRKHHSKGNNLVALHFKYDFWHRTATAGSDVVQSGRPIFDDFFQHLWPYIGNNTANVVFQMVKRLWLICIGQ